MEVSLCATSVWSRFQFAEEAARSSHAGGRLRATLHCGNPNIPDETRTETRNASSRSEVLAKGLKDFPTSQTMDFRASWAHRLGFSVFCSITVYRDSQVASLN